MPQHLLMGPLQACCGAGLDAATAGCLIVCLPGYWLAAFDRRLPRRLADWLACWRLLLGTMGLWFRHVLRGSGNLGPHPRYILMHCSSMGVRFRCILQGFSDLDGLFRRVCSVSAIWIAVLVASFDFLAIWGIVSANSLRLGNVCLCFCCISVF